MRKRINIIILVLVLLLCGCLYQTFALTSYVDENNLLTINSDNVITVSGGSSKVVYFRILNENNGTVRYGVGYKGNNADVKVFSDSPDVSQGKIGKNENKFVKLYIENTGSTDTSVSLKPILGYENGGELILNDGYTLVTKVKPSSSFSNYIKFLFDDGVHTDINNNSILFDYNTLNSLMIDDDDNIRYYGSSPNNYVYFNCGTYPSTDCEKWRIIGVFDGKIKLMRNEIIGSYSWDNKVITTGAETSFGKNDWNSARLMMLLNPGYESESTGGSLYWNSGYGGCYAGMSNKDIDCTFVNTGIKNYITRSMISDSTWYLKGYKNSDIFSNQSYDYERNGTIFNTTSRSSTWDGKVALPYLSDYGYADDFRICKLNINNYNTDDCRNNNWMSPILSTSSLGWLLDPIPSYSYLAHIVTSNGNASLSGDSVYVAGGVTPTFFISSDIDLLGGDGTQDNPYTIDTEGMPLTEPAKTYTIVYDDNGGSGGPGSQVKTEDIDLTISDVVPTKEGYTFLGWALTSSATDSKYQPGDVLTSNEDMTLYAVWQDDNATSFTVNIYEQIGHQEPKSLTSGTADLNKNFIYLYPFAEYNNYGNPTVSCTNGQSGSVLHDTTLNFNVVISNVTANTTCTVHWANENGPYKVKIIQEYGTTSKTIATSSVDKGDGYSTSYKFRDRAYSNYSVSCTNGQNANVTMTKGLLQDTYKVSVYTVSDDTVCTVLHT